LVATWFGKSGCKQVLSNAPVTGVGAEKSTTNVDFTTKAPPL
jgi:hypothetical protein